MRRIRPVLRGLFVASIACAWCACVEPTDIPAHEVSASEPSAGSSSPDAEPPREAGPPLVDAGVTYPPPDLEVDTSAAGNAVPDDFLGLSVEWHHSVTYLGNGTGGLEPRSVQLLKNFSADGHTLSVRIGGNSEDFSWWSPTGGPRPGAVLVDLGPAHLSTLAALHTALGTRFVLGLNLLLGDGVNAAALANAALAAIPKSAVTAFELGNEPDVYVLNGKRNLLYGFGAFKSEMDTLRDAVASRVVPAPPFAAPALALDGWLSQLPAFYAAESTRLSLITTHLYPFVTPCLNLPPPAPAALLAKSSTTDLAAKYAPHAKAAHAAGYGFRMAEMNSVSCGGVDGVSNAYVSALWGAHIAFDLAAAGLDGVNFHTPGTFYAAFAYSASGELSVRPLYYGMKFFSMATANGGRIVPITVPKAPSVHAWATRDRDGAVRVALLNVGSSATTLRIRAKGSKSTAASVVRLVGADLSAKSGISLGAQTWDGSLDGKPLGAPTTEAAPLEGDTYVVTVPALQGLLLTSP